MAVIVGLLGFVLHLQGMSSSSTNGVRTSCSAFDLGPFVVAVVCLIAGVRCLRNRRDPARDARLETAAAAIGLAFALIHVIRGLLIASGALGPCA